MKPMIIDFVGSHSTGKTTLMRQTLQMLVKNQISSDIIESVTRSKIENVNMLLYDKTDDTTQAWISLYNWSNILNNAAYNQVTMCTDLGVRSLAYTLASPNMSKETELAHRNMIYFFRDSLAEVFDVHWIYLPIEFPMESDGTRKEDEEYRILVDVHTKDILHGCRLPYITVKGGMEDRYELMKQLIQVWLNRLLNY